MTKITFRHMEGTEALRAYVEDKIDKATRALQQNFESQVVLSVEKYQQIAEIMVTWEGATLIGSSRSEDMYAAIDEAMAKVEEQVRRSKEKRQSPR